MTTVWGLFVDCDPPVLFSFSVNSVMDLNHKVKADLSIREPTSRLSVWKLNSPIDTDDESAHRLQRQQFLSDPDTTATRLGVRQKFAEFDQWDSESVQVLVTLSRALITVCSLSSSPDLFSNEGPTITATPLGQNLDLNQYKDCFIKARDRYKLDDMDLVPNCIELASVSDLPDLPDEHHIKTYLSCLNTVRKLDDKHLGLHAQIRELAGLTTEEYAQFFSATSTDLLPEPILALAHMISLCCQFDRKTSDIRFKQDDADQLFFVSYCRWLRLIYPDRQNRLVYGFRTKAWPSGAPLVIVVGKERYAYSPLPDYFMAKDGILRLSSEVYSQGTDDEHRAIIASTGLLRLVNHCLEEEGKPRDFVIPVLYFDRSKEARIHLLYEDPEPEVSANVQTVQSLQLPTLNMLVAKDRLKLAWMMYNQGTALRAQDTVLATVLSKLQAYSAAVQDAKYPGFASRKRTRDETEKKKNTAKAGGGSNYQGNITTTALLESGFASIQPLRWPLKDWSSSRSTSETASEVYVVRKDEKDFVAKHARFDRSEKSESLERHIISYLFEKGAIHVVRLITAIPSPMGEWLLFPLHLSVGVEMASGSLSGRFLLFSTQLIEAVAFLHGQHVAHRDLKPDNLVVTHENSELQLIDFDVSVQVRDENEQVKGYVGTKFWTAPEVGDGDGPDLWHSPIRADRWACGAILEAFTKHFISLEQQTESGKAIRSFTLALKNFDPMLRPALSEWDSHLRRSTSKGPSGGDESRQNGIITRGETPLKRRRMEDAFHGDHPLYPQSLLRDARAQQMLIG